MLDPAGDIEHKFLSWRRTQRTEPDRIWHARKVSSPSAVDLGGEMHLLGYCLSMGRSTSSQTT
jgi:hypothetical protein